MPTIMWRAWSPVIVKYRLKKICVVRFDSSGPIVAT